MIVEFSTEAESDLERIATTLQTTIHAARFHWSKQLRGKCESLADVPLGFPLVSRYERHGIRRRVHGNYLIFYLGGWRKRCHHPTFYTEQWTMPLH